MASDSFSHPCLGWSLGTAEILFHLLPMPTVLKQCHLQNPKGHVKGVAFPTDSATASHKILVRPSAEA